MRCEPHIYCVYTVHLANQELCMINCWTPPFKPSLPTKPPNLTLPHWPLETRNTQHRYVICVNTKVLLFTEFTDRQRCRHTIICSARSPASRPLPGPQFLQTRDNHKWQTNHNNIVNIKTKQLLLSLSELPKRCPWKNQQAGFQRDVNTMRDQREERFAISEKQQSCKQQSWTMELGGNRRSSNQRVNNHGCGNQAWTRVQ